MSQKKSSVRSITRKQLAAELANRHNIPKAQSEAVLASLTDIIIESLQKDRRVRMGKLGTLTVRKSAPRMGRNPRTGEPIKIDAKRRIVLLRYRDRSRDWP